MLTLRRTQNVSLAYMHAATHPRKDVLATVYNYSSKKNFPVVFNSFFNFSTWNVFCHSFLPGTWVSALFRNKSIPLCRREIAKHALQRETWFTDTSFYKWTRYVWSKDTTLLLSFPHPYKFIYKQMLFHLFSHGITILAISSTLLIVNCQIGFFWVSYSCMTWSKKLFFFATQSFINSDRIFIGRYFTSAMLLENEVCWCWANGV